MPCVETASLETPKHSNWPEARRSVPGPSSAPPASGAPCQGLTWPSCALSPTSASSTATSSSGTPPCPGGAAYNNSYDILCAMILHSTSYVPRATTRTMTASTSTTATPPLPLLPKLCCCCLSSLFCYVIVCLMLVLLPELSPRAPLHSEVCP